MNAREFLISEIESAFRDVVFPKHLGLLAARLRDDWIEDKTILEEETLKKDFNGPWSSVPREHISGENLGFNYLDKQGVDFYLPAFMLLAIKDPIYKNLYTLEFELVPSDSPWTEAPKTVSGEEMYKYYCEKFSRITDQKKIVVVLFMEYILSLLGDKKNLHKHSWENGTIERFKQAASHKHWQVNS